MNNPTQTPPGKPTGQISFWLYMRTRHFVVTLLAVFLGLLAIVLVLLYVLLPLLTRHSSNVTVPEVTDLTYAQAATALEAAGLKPEVIDSQYYANLPPLSIISQEPAALEKVKPDRTIYLVVNRVQAPGTKLPDVVEVNLQQARYLLENWGLKMGNLYYVSGIARDLVLKASQKGHALKPGDPVQIGSRIDLTISRGLGSEPVEVPDLVGMTLDEATSRLNDLRLGVGGVRFGETKKFKKSGIVFRQNPTAGQDIKVQEGNTVDLFVTGSEEQLNGKSESGNEKTEEPAPAQ